LKVHQNKQFILREVGMYKIFVMIVCAFVIAVVGCGSSKPWTDDESTAVVIVVDIGDNIGNQFVSLLISDANSKRKVYAIGIKSNDFKKGDTVKAVNYYIHPSPFSPGVVLVEKN
jgi:hypothetical protein